jgi:probable rRNA maturation factor
MKKEWKKIKNRVLGEKYDLSVVLAREAMMKKLNETYRKKEGPTDVLSFSLSPTMGEIFINKKAAHKDYLFIHSLLHLKGLKHGKEMEKEEQKIWPEISSQE